MWDRFMCCKIASNLGAGSKWISLIVVAVHVIFWGQGYTIFRMTRVSMIHFASACGMLDVYVPLSFEYRLNLVCQLVWLNSLVFLRLTGLEEQTIIALTRVLRAA